LKQSDYALAGRHADAANAQPVRDQVHRTQPQPCIARRALHLQRRYDRDAMFARRYECRSFERRESDAQCNARGEDAKSSKHNIYTAALPVRGLGRRRTGAIRRWRIQRGGCRRLDVRHNRAGHQINVGDPAVAVAGDGANDLLQLTIVADGTPRAQHGLTQLRIGYVWTAPDRFDEFVLVNRAVAMFDQVDQAVECA
jgi:hypothetical protein